MCRSVGNACDVTCGITRPDQRTCARDIRTCRSAVRADYRVCRVDCSNVSQSAERNRCVRGCRLGRAEGERSCGFQGAEALPGTGDLPDFVTGEPADLSLLTEAERATIAAADARAATLRSRTLRIAASPGTEIRLSQVRHGFDFGLALDTAKFVGRESDLDFFLGTAAQNHLTIAVTESSAKWNRVEPAPGVRDFSLFDRDVAAALDYGYRVKGHPLSWGIVPPFSQSGAPPWAFERYADVPLAPALQVELRDVLRAHVEAMVARHRDDVRWWDVTNETLQPLAQWAVVRLGPAIVEDLFRWAHAADPDAILVFNEWIIEVFTGLPAPSAAEVRDRVLALRAAGTPVHAVGQQSHFAPALAFAGLPADLDTRTPIDQYAVALDTLAETGLPIHLTETNFVAPREPELRAAHAEGLLRLWWGHPSVEQVIFWGLWNEVAGRDEFDVGLWRENRELSRHGAAVFSLLNERWRTEVVGLTDADGFLSTEAVHGEYVASWDEDGRPLHARFSVRPGNGPLKIVLVSGEGWARPVDRMVSGGLQGISGHGRRSRCGCPSRTPGTPPPHSRRAAGPDRGLRYD